MGHHMGHHRFTCTAKAGSICVVPTTHRSSCYFVAPVFDESPIGPVMPISFEFIQFQEKFGFFDIHEYGAVVIDKLEKEHLQNDNDKPVPFKKVVEDKEIFHVSRLFLSSLQLVSSFGSYF